MRTSLATAVVPGPACQHQTSWGAEPPPPHGVVPTYVPAELVLPITERSAVLDGHCAAIGRDPRTITRSVQYVVSYDDPATDRQAITELIAAGVTHIVLSLRSPYPPQVLTISR
ncbi:hypothetical protein ACWDGI_39940 [Streptomyces sp. NPDC001220]